MFGESLISDTQDDSIWIAETGASHHMTKARDYFATYTAFERPKPITLENKSFMMAYYQGDINFEIFVIGLWLKNKLTDAWYTPDEVKYLFSKPSSAKKRLNPGLMARLAKLSKMIRILRYVRDITVCIS